MGTFRQPGIGQDWVSLPQHFRDNGYNTAGVQKLFHPQVPANDDAPWSWTVPYVQLGGNSTNLCTERCCGITSGPASDFKLIYPYIYSCMYIYIYIYLYLYIHLYLYLYIDLYIYLYLYLYIHIYMCVCITSTYFISPICFVWSY